MLEPDTLIENADKTLPSNPDSPPKCGREKLVQLERTCMPVKCACSTTLNEWTLTPRLPQMLGLLYRPGHFYGRGFYDR